MGYRVLTIPLKDISIKTVLYEILHFHQASYACYYTYYTRVYPFSFEGRESPGAPPHQKIGYGV